MYKSILLIPVLTVFLLAACTMIPDEPGNLVPLTVTEDTNLPAIEVNGARLHSEAFGPVDSTMVICIHGGPGADYRYMLNCMSLAAHGYRVIFYDQSGSGLSQRFDAVYYTSRGEAALDIMYDELAGVIEHYRTSPEQKVYLLGHSWGAMLASGFAGKYPEKVQGLIACEPGGLLWEDIITYVTESRSFSLWSELMNDATYIDQFINGDADDHEVLDYKLSILAAENTITGEYNEEDGFWRSGAVVNSALFEVGNTYEVNLSEGLDNFHTPVLFIYSEYNLAYSDNWAEQISSAYQERTLFKVLGVGHSGIVQDTEAWNTITEPRILTYFEQLETE